METLDGDWNVRRLAGLLPPLVGVRKRIHGGTGETSVGPLPGMPFDVSGLSLRYRRPFRDFVDVLEPEGDRYLGRATFRGRTFGRFALERAHDAGGPPTTSQDLKGQLVSHIDEALAMEQNVQRMLDGMIETTGDEEIRSALREHRLETEQHVERLRQRLDAHGAFPSMAREAGGIMTALMKSVLDIVRQDRAGRNARDAYATEHLEIASYQLLERIAERAGDTETAEAARRNRADEEAMARRIEGSWDRFVELSLEERGVTL